MLSYDGKLTEQGKYPGFGDAQLIDVCPTENDVSTDFKQLGCGCALDGDGAVLCLATTDPPVLDDPTMEVNWSHGGVVMRSVAGAAKSETVFKIEDFPLLDGYFLNLFSGI
jgi:hypothetical protein